jgi:hypothetical protein
VLYPISAIKRAEEGKNNEGYMLQEFIEYILCFEGY